MKNKIFGEKKEGNALKPQNSISTVKHGGGTMMLWGCSAAEVTGALYKIKA